MIGKVPSAGKGFRGIVNYLLLGKRGHGAKDRVAWAETLNLAVDDPDLAPSIMRATARRSLRCKTPVYHLALSWHYAENPTPELMKLVGKQTLEDLGLSNHQAILLAHEDTAHKHLHVVVNRVDPDTGKAWDRWQDWVKIEKSLRRQAEALGIPYVPGRHNDPDAFYGKPKKVRDREYQAALRHAAPKPPDHLTKDQIAHYRSRLVETIEKSSSWEELDRALAADRIAIARKGQGLILVTDDGFLKLSELKKSIRLGTLEDRFGERYDDYAQSLMTDEDAKRKPTANDDGAADEPATALVLPHEQAPGDMSGDPDGGTTANETADAGQDGASAGGMARPHQIEHPPLRKKPTAEEAARRAQERVDKEWQRQKDNADRELARAELKRKWEERRAQREARAQQLIEAKARAKAEREHEARQQAATKTGNAVDKPTASDKLIDKVLGLNAKTPTPEQQAQGTADAELQQAMAQADLAFRLYRAGLISRKQLARANRDREIAEEKVLKQKSGAEQIKQAVKSSLKPGKPGAGGDGPDGRARKKGRGR